MDLKTKSRRASKRTMADIPDDFSRMDRPKHALPTDLYSDERFQDRYFFALPSSLISALETSDKPIQFDNKLWRLEHRMARLADGWPGTIGWFKRFAIVDFRLSPVSFNANELPMLESTQWADERSITTTSVIEGLKGSAQRLDGFSESAAGYCGWLISSPEFCREQDDFFETWETEIRELGLPTIEFAAVFPGQPNSESTLSSLKANVLSESKQRFLEAYENFNLRWRLERLIAPFVPQPQMPQIPQVLPSQLARSLHESAGTFSIPDTFPLPAKDRFRELVSQARNPINPPEHLREWHKIVAPGNPSKGSIATYARRYRFIHYWSVLHSRHAMSLDRQAGKLESAFAAHLRNDLTSTETIRKDRTACRRAIAFRSNSKIAQMGFI